MRFFLENYAEWKGVRADASIFKACPLEPNSWRSWPLLARKMKDMEGGVEGRGLDLNCVDKSLGDNAEASKAEQAN